MKNVLLLTAIGLMTMPLAARAQDVKVNHAISVARSRAYFQNHSFEFYIAGAGWYFLSIT